LYENKENKIRVIENPEVGPIKSQMEIIKQDPNYAFIFNKDIEPRQIIETIKSRITLLQEDWDKPQNVFSEKLSIGTGEKVLEKKRIH
jgi:hypothetical protein